MTNFIISKEEAEVLQMGLFVAKETLNLQIDINAGHYSGQIALTEGYAGKPEELQRGLRELEERLKSLFLPETLNFISHKQAEDAENYVFESVLDILKDELGEYPTLGQVLERKRVFERTLRCKLGRKPTLPELINYIEN